MILIFFQIISKNIMADISVKESPCYTKYKSFISTSTPHKSINDSGYNTSSSTLSNVSSNLHQISEVNISFDHASSDLSVFKLSSPTHNFTLDSNSSKNKLDDITNKTDFKTNFSSITTHQEYSPTKKFKLFSDTRMRFHSTRFEDNENTFLKRKNFISRKDNNHERTSVEGRENIDIMYFLAERHHFEPVIEKIFSYLSGSDIVSMSMVSKIWCNTVKNSPMAQKKKRMYFKLSKENRGGYSGRDHSAFHNKGYLANISNVMHSPSKRDLPQRSPPVSPSKYRFHVFQKVNTTLIIYKFFQLVIFILIT